MKKLRSLALFFFMLVCALALNTNAYAATGDVWIVPATDTMGPNSNFILEVHVDSGTSLVAAIDFTITFDQTRLNLDLTQGAGSSGVDAGTAWVGATTIPNTATANTTGTMSVVGFDIAGKGPGTDLQILKLYFKSLTTVGTSAVTITVNQLADENGVAIGAAPPRAGTGSSITVTNTLTVIKNGTGVGTVTSDVGLINCGGTCSDNYDVGTVVTLTATPGGCATFTGWSGGGCSGTGTCVVTMNAATSVTATFTASANYTLTVTKAGNGSGTVTPDTGSLTAGNPSTGSFGCGSVVNLTATPAVSSTFTGWTGDADCADGSVTMNSAVNCTATFTLKTFTVTFANDGNGTVTGVSPQTPINYGASATAVTAVPNSGFHFVNWTGTGGFVTSTANPLTVTNVTADMTITANFSNTSTVTFVAGAHGTLTGVTPQTVADGVATTAVTAVPDAGYHFVNWTGTGGFVTSTTNPITVTPAGGDMTVTANFAPDGFTLTVLKNGPGSVTGTSISCGTDCSELFPVGTSVTLTAVPDAGYTFTGWSGAGCSGDGDCTVTMTANSTVTAYFACILPLPQGQDLFMNDASVTSDIGSCNPAEISPIGVGLAAFGYPWLKLNVSLPQFEGAVDVYLAVFAPAIDPDNIYLMNEEDNLQLLSLGLVPWKAGLMTDINNMPRYGLDRLFGDHVDAGSYVYGLLVVPQGGDFGTYYFWVTSAEVN